MHRFFCEQLNTDFADITGEDVRHIRKVLRLSAGETVMLCDGHGAECKAEIVSLAEERVVCRCGSWEMSPSESCCAVTLFQGLPKSGKLETIIQKCVELGVSAVVPTHMSRCVPVPGDDFSKKLTRFRRVALEAAKQSGRGRIPDVSALVTLARVDLSGYDAAFVAYEDECAVSFKQALSGMRPARVALFIGPEGGFEHDEVELLIRKGAVSVSLGRRILRTETAGMAMLAQLMYEVEP